MNSESFLDQLLQRYARFSPHTRDCGIEITALSAEGVSTQLPYREDWLGDADSGRLHPGVLSVLIDSSAGVALMAHLGQPERIATLDLRIDHLRPAFAGSALHCHAHCYRKTSSIAFLSAEAWQDDRERPIARAQLVFARNGVRNAGVV
ncbi:uncharacterized domain 1-containing protein [Solimonas aquatica]|uniref:Uncharacterized domain 1-containing protein n=1 Tax=Solimonas aquatica TaxID=489703 RepID=A0A1H9I4D5_9GAMM|nr:PaaI family thioesterase [Solimonas aquatica]SEQ69460.1 uncharacterized domain 1-containing protein [Solimonas aquatica]